MTHCCRSGVFDRFILEMISYVYNLTVTLVLKVNILYISKDVMLVESSTYILKYKD